MANERDPLLPNRPKSVTVTDDRPQPSHVGPLDISKSTRYGILAGLWSATFLSALNMTLVATLLPSISSDFNKSNEASWLGTSYLLAACTFTPLYGRLCNVMGRRGANQLAVVVAATGTIACGFSKNMEMLIAARFLTGMGGGGIFTTSTIVTSDMYSIRSRGLAQGFSNLFNGLGMGLGGPIGGLVSDRFGWRWAFLMQMPLFFVSLILTSYNLRYVTPGKGKSAKEVLKRIDYGGSFTLLVAVGSFLVFLSMKYNEDLSWNEPVVIIPLALACVSFVLFVLVELLVAPEPVLAPFLLRQKIPVLCGISNFLVALCNFSVMYFFPMWFQTVALTSASTAGLHLLPNSTSMSIGSLFAGYMMHRTGRYKMINLIFGFFPFIGIMLITQMREDSGPLQMWLSIIPLGFGNAVVLQTMLIALLAHIPESAMAVGTGFGQVFRGIGQVGGVAISSALFQSKLDTELHRRIHTPDAEEVISKIRHSAKLVASLPPDLQRAARDSYAISLKAVFVLAACSTFLAYLVRLPIPEKALEHGARKKANDNDGAATREDIESRTATPAISEEALESGDSEDTTPPARPVLKAPARRLSTFESTDGTQDLESDTVGGSARQR
ncbi:MFS general substrate transporter [Leucogyrophana mollusca]|uniref:MFS general substrate transporter n=1 Tax=Leucogyrophana mollusca TaxID=85980 RepID=A0ACB8BEF8_9AGAM|nr:MFS general substrate transporter [Leucogyrophana mollusca]